MEEWHGGIIVTYLVVLVNKNFRKQNKLQKIQLQKDQIINQNATLIFFRNTMLVMLAFSKVNLFFAFIGVQA